VLIFMNQPLRYAGKTFYQASFGKGDTLSVLQVVKNPGWLLPYISWRGGWPFGLILHFAVCPRPRAAEAAASSGGPMSAARMATRRRGGVALVGVASAAVRPGRLRASTSTLSGTCPCSKVGG